MVTSRFSAEDDLVIPWSYIDYGLQDDEATEQHKAHRGHKLHKRSIRHYRHATSKWGAALENFSPMVHDPGMIHDSTAVDLSSGSLSAYHPEVSLWC